MIKEYLVPAILIGATVLCVGTGFVAYDQGQESTKLKYENIISKANLKFAGEKTALIQKASDLTASHAMVLGEIDQKHLRERNEDNKKADSTIAAFRDDNLRLRKRLGAKGPATERGTDTAQGSGVCDGAGGVGLQSADVEFLVRFANDADQVANSLRACQGVVTSYQDLYRKAWPEASEAILNGPE